MQPATERRLLQRARTSELHLFQDLMEPGSEQVLASAYDEWWYKLLIYFNLNSTFTISPHGCHSRCLWKELVDA